MKNFLFSAGLFILLNSLLIGCTSNLPTPTYQVQVQKIKGNFRYYAGIAEFFDCKTQTKHYVAKDGVYEEMLKAYQDLKLREKDDVYVSFEGFYREEEQMDGVDPYNMFVATKILKIDTTRSCKRPYRRGL